MAPADATKASELVSPPHRHLTRVLRKFVVTIHAVLLPSRPCPCLYHRELIRRRQYLRCALLVIDGYGLTERATSVMPVRPDPLLDGYTIGTMGSVGLFSTCVNDANGGRSGPNMHD